MMADRKFEQEIEELREEYLGELSQMVKAMREHAGHLNNAAKVKTSYPLLLYLAHQVKGTAGTLGFDRFSEVARNLAHDLEEFLDREVPVSREDLSKKALDHVDQLEILLEENN